MGTNLEDFIVEAHRILKPGLDLLNKWALKEENNLSKQINLKNKCYLLTNRSLFSTHLNITDSY